MGAERKRGSQPSVCEVGGNSAGGDRVGVKSVLRKEKYECSLLCADKQPSAGRSRLGSRGSGLQLPRWGGGPGRSPRVPSRQQHQHSGGAGGRCPRPTPARSSPERAQHQLWPSKVSRTRHRRGPKSVRKETPSTGRTASSASWSLESPLCPGGSGNLEQGQLAIMAQGLNLIMT